MKFIKPSFSFTTSSKKEKSHDKQVAQTKAQAEQTHLEQFAMQWAKNMCRNMGIPMDA